LFTLHTPAPRSGEPWLARIVSKVVTEIPKAFPIPSTEIVNSHIWGEEKGFLRINIHLNACYHGTISNISERVTL